MSVEQSLDWKKLSAVNLSELSKTKNHPSIQDNIPNILNCNPLVEFNMSHVDSNFHKLFSLAQITIRNLMESQSYLSGVIVAMGDKIKAAQEKELSNQKENAEVNERLARYKKKCSVLAKMMHVQREMVAQNNNGEANCQFCLKSFASLEYLLSHMQRRHPNNLQQFNPSILISGKKYGAVANGALMDDLANVRSKIMAHSEGTKQKNVCDISGELKLDMLKDSNQKNICDILWELKSDILKKVDERFASEEMTSKFEKEIENLKSSFNMEIKDISEGQNKILSQMESLTQKGNIGELEREPNEEIIGKLSEDYEEKIRKNEEENRNLLKMELENWGKKQRERESEHQSRVDELESIIVELRVQVKRMEAQIKGEEKKVTTNVPTNLAEPANVKTKDLRNKQIPTLPKELGDYRKMGIRLLKIMMKKVGIDEEATELAEAGYVIAMDKLQMRKREEKNVFFECRQKAMVELDKRMSSSANTSVVNIR